MKREGTAMRYAVVLVGLLMLPAAGCRQNADPNSRQARLAVATNAELEQQVARYEAQIADYEQQLAARDTELAAARRLNESLQQEVKTGIEARVSAVTTKIMDDNARLRRENEALHAELTALRAEQ